MKRSSVLILTSVLLLISMVVLGQQQPGWQFPEAREPKSKGSVGAPSQDDYYFYENPNDRVPEEFLAHRTLRGVTQGQLKGYHLPPILYSVEVENRSVKAGETVRWRALYDDKSGEINFLSASFQGPVGRRTNINGRCTPNAKNAMLLECQLKLSPWAEPGRYFSLEMHTANRLGHAKGYFSDFHPALSDLWFDVAPNPNMDVTPPLMNDFQLFDGKPNPKIKISDLIPIRAKVVDERSGVRDVKVTIQSPSGKFAEVTLMRSMSEKDVYLGVIQLNPFYEAGQYKAQRVSIQDNAGNERHYFETEDIIGKNKFTVDANDKTDLNSPQLVTVTLDKDRAGFNEDVKISAIVTDNLSGVEHVTVFVQSPSILDKRRVQLRAKAKPPIIIVPRFDVNANTFEGTFKVDPLDEPGVWTVSRVVATDFANNHMDIQADDNPQLGTIGVAVGTSGAPAPASSTNSQAAASPGNSETPGKIRRVDMIPPHPIRGACINCHEP